MGFCWNQVAPARSKYLLGLKTGHKIQQHIAVRKVENTLVLKNHLSAAPASQVRMSPLRVTGSSTLPVQHLWQAAAAALAHPSASDPGPTQRGRYLLRARRKEAVHRRPYSQQCGWS